MARKGNPFLPYNPELWIADLSETHALLLNKYNLVDHHVLVVTRRFEDQNEPLTLGDVSASWAVLTCMPEGGLAFFNCGPRSGASQPHKHTQVVPLSAVPLDPWYKASIERTAGMALDLPFVAFGVGLCPTVEAQGIYESYLGLLDAAQPWLRGKNASYNVIWTRDWLILIPRSKEKHVLSSLNSLAFAGTLFVRSEEELELVRERGLMTLLVDVAFSSSDGA